MRAIEYVGYLFEDSILRPVQHHPQFLHLNHPPEGYSFKSDPIEPQHVEDVTAAINHLDGVVPPFPTGVARIDRMLAALHGVAVAAKAYGADMHHVRSFLLSRDVRANLRIPEDAALAFVPSYPMVLCGHPWVIEIEDVVTLFFPYFVNGQTLELDIKRHPALPIIRAFLESPSCRAIITHIRSTADSLARLFDSAIINGKIAYAPLGVPLPELMGKKQEAHPEVNLLFTNSWHQGANNFYLRGGHDVLEAFSILAERYPQLTLTLRSALPPLSPAHQELLDHHPRIRHLPGFLPADDLHRLFLDTDIYLIPAARVHIVSALGAMAYGIPVLASDGWGFTEYIRHGLNGFTLPGRYGVCSWVDHRTGLLREDYSLMARPDGFEPEMVNQIVETVSRLIDEPALRQRIGQAARQSAESEFNLTRWNTMLKTIFDHAISFSDAPLPATVKPAREFRMSIALSTDHDGSRTLSWIGTVAEAIAAAEIEEQVEVVLIDEAGGPGGLDEALRYVQGDIRVVSRRLPQGADEASIAAQVACPDRLLVLDAENEPTESDIRALSAAIAKLANEQQSGDAHAMPEASILAPEEVRLESGASPEEIAEGFRRRRPWITRFFINGRSYGNEASMVHRDAALGQFFIQFPAARSVLELGSLEGAHTFYLARHPGQRRVVAIEGRQYNVEKARFVQDLTTVTNICFLHGNLETMDLTSLGRFDAIFCAGLLYHLPEPWKLIRRLSEVSSNLFLRTHYATEANANHVANGFLGYRYREQGYHDPCSGLSDDSFWPTLDALQHMLAINGFPEITVIEDYLHRNGAMVTLAATR